MRPVRPVLGLLPLDERPVCTVLPRALAAIADVEVLVAPEACLPSRRQPGDPEAAGSWVQETKADGFVVSLETLGMGGLISSRTGDESERVVLERWGVLSTLSAPVHASFMIPRAPDVDDDCEEPWYWAQWGRALAAHGRMAAGDRWNHALDPGVPEQVRTDWVRRRLRQHSLALAALGMAQDGVLTSLDLTMDDNSPGTMSSRSADELRWWAGLLPGSGVRVRSGADENASLQVAGAAGTLLGVRAQLDIVCAEKTGLNRIAPYESITVGESLAAAADSAKAQVIPGADVVMVVHPPMEGDVLEGRRVPGLDWALTSSAPELPAAEESIALVGQALTRGAHVVVADCRYPNGSDPRLVEGLAERGLLGRLAGYAGWNTASNAAGTALACAALTSCAYQSGRHRPQASRRLLAHRLLEDHVWMTDLRQKVRRQLGTLGPPGHDRVQLTEQLARELAEQFTAALTRLVGDSSGHVRGDSVRLPWDRTFEIDFEVVEP